MIHEMTDETIMADASRLHTEAATRHAVLDVQGLGISTNAEDPAAAAAFLEFLQSPDQLKAFWAATGWLPSNTTFDPSVIQDASVRGLWENWGLKPNISNVTNLMPGQFYERAAIPTGQQIVQGSLTGEQAGEFVRVQ